MKITLKFVLDLFKDVVKTYNINKNDLNTVFDWIDIVKTNTIKPESEPKKILFCAVYEEQPEKDGWYELGFDKRIKILEVWRKSPNTIFLVDRTLNNTLELKTIGVKIVEIPDIFDGCEIIFRKILEITQPLVIGVTGSVGKTTTVALLEDIFLTEGKVLRIYSKRLSPLSIMTCAINNLEQDTKFIVMEYSLYRSNHVFELARLLTPNIALLLNIQDSHIGIDINLKNQKDLFRAKVVLLESAEKSIISRELIDYYDESNLRLKKLFIFDNTPIKNVSPFVDTNLMWLQINSSLLVYKLATNKEPDSLVYEKINNFSPKENRLLKFVYTQNSILFCGESTYASRLFELINGNHENCKLILLNLDTGNEPIGPQLALFKKIRGSISEIYICESVEPKYADLVANILKPELMFKVNQLEKILSKPGTYIVHYGGFFKRNTEKLFFM